MNTDSIIDHIADSIIVITPERKIKTVNRATCSMLEYKEEELIGENISILFSRDGLETAPFEGTAETGRINDQEYKKCRSNYVTKEGGKIPVLLSISALVDNDRNVNGIICVAHDITEIRQAEVEVISFATELQKSNSELREFLNIASHDLQEPLRKILSFSDCIKSRHADVLDNRGHDYIRRLQNAARRMRTLIYDLLIFTKLTSDARIIEPTDLGDVAQEVVSDLKEYIEETGGQVEIDKLPAMDADPYQMHQLLQNLINNSLKFRKKNEPPLIRISGKYIPANGDNQPNNDAYEKILELSVEDNGIGFDEKYTDRIFRVFQRLHALNEYEGTGIGLSVCKKIAERHGGSISARSKPGEGARFIVTLPMKKSDGEIGA